MRKLRHIAVRVLCAVGALLPVQFLGVTVASVRSGSGLDHFVDLRDMVG
jgi:hypothetical protein